jgi:hypothetical protein
MPIKAIPWFQAALQDYDQSVVQKKPRPRQLPRALIATNLIHSAEAARAYGLFAASFDELERSPDSDRLPADRRSNFQARRKLIPLAAASEGVIAATVTGSASLAPVGCELAALDISLRSADPLFESDSSPQTMQIDEKIGTFDPRRSPDGKAPESHTFPIALEKGKAYRFFLSSNGADPFLSLLSEQGRKLASDDDSGGNLASKIDWNCTASGTYRLVATTTAGKHHGTFRLVVNELVRGSRIKLAPAKIIVFRHDGELVDSDPLLPAKLPTRTKIFDLQLMGGVAYRFRFEGASLATKVRLGLRHSNHDDAEATRTLTGKSLEFDYIPSQTALYSLTVVSTNPLGNDIQFTLTAPNMRADVEWAAHLVSAGVEPWSLIGGVASRDALQKVGRGFDTILQHQSKLTSSSPIHRLRKTPCEIIPLEFEANRKYEISMSSTQMDSYLRLETPNGLAAAFDDDSGGNLNARILYMPKSNARMNIVATCVGAKLGEFQLTVRRENENVAANAPLRSEAIRWTPADPWDTPKERKRHQVFAFAAVPGETYTVDLQSSDFDTFLRVEEDSGKFVAENDDGGDGSNSRIVFRTVRPMTHRLIVTSFEEGMTGRFTLTVKKRSTAPSP